MSQESLDRPSADVAAEEVTSAGEGTDTGNPIAGLELDRDEAPPVVSGDTGPEGTRRTALAPPTE
ncbi:hypothetical protein [Quadrisphaera sp. DSM 44207]|uniref:hypothetical protein n=1 Tax=Quadrisphaera sp. DSM 44207 TaxID=1881057 RepID=UPI00088484B5|nr:hypothetical protein [Quadrisphaera sp. DSM 44207]SDQ67188.1 hypothetical protein SAMN05428996_2325 [Quadrisphaera sp. DSM 44207]